MSAYTTNLRIFFTDFFRAFYTNAHIFGKNSIKSISEIRDNAYFGFSSEV